MDKEKETETETEKETGTETEKETEKETEAEIDYKKLYENEKKQNEILSRNNEVLLKSIKVDEVPDDKELFGMFFRRGGNK